MKNGPITFRWYQFLTRKHQYGRNLISHVKFQRFKGINYCLQFMYSYRDVQWKIESLNYIQIVIYRFSDNLSILKLGDKFFFCRFNQFFMRMSILQLSNLISEFKKSCIINYVSINNVYFMVYCWKNLKRTILMKIYLKNINNFKEFGKELSSCDSYVNTSTQSLILMTRPFYSN